MFLSDASVTFLKLYECTWADSAPQHPLLGGISFSSTSAKAYMSVTVSELTWNQSKHSLFLRCLRHVWALRIDSIHISHLKRPFILYFFLCSHIDEHASWIKYLNKLCIHFIVSCDGGFSSDQYESADYESVATGRIYTSLSCRRNCEVNRLAGFVTGGLESFCLLKISLIIYFWIKCLPNE